MKRKFIVKKMAIVFVRFGFDQKLLVNSDCSPYIFMSWIRNVCDVTDPNIVLDLTDEDGNLQNISSISSSKLTSSKLVERTEYILVKVDKEKHSVTVIPLLQNWKPLIKHTDDVARSKFSRGSGRKQSLQR